MTSRWTKVADVPAKHAPYQDPCRTQRNMQWPRKAGIGGFFSCGQSICLEQREQAPFVFSEIGSGRLTGTKTLTQPGLMNGEQGGNGGGEKSGMMGFESGKQGREDRPLAVNRLTPTTHRIDDKRFGSPRGCGDHGTRVEQGDLLSQDPPVSDFPGQ